MAYLNYFLQFKAFADKKPSNNPSLSLSNWVRDVHGVAVANVSTQYIEIPANSSVTVFTASSKKFAYVEADAPIDLTINGASTPLTITPVVIGSTTQPGSFLINASLSSLVLTNTSTTDVVGIFLAHAE